MTPADILDKAADVLETRGWFQGSWYPGFNAPDGLAVPADGCEVCVLAAINAATDKLLDEEFGPSLRRDAALALANHVGIDINTGPAPDGWDLDEDVWEEHVAETITAHVGGWNDEASRTRGEVVAALRAAAADLRQNTTEGTS